MRDVAISAHGLGKLYRVGQVEHGFARAKRALLRREGQGSIWAVDDLSFEVTEGETLAVIGRNGAGKSTLLKILSRITEPTKGYVDIRGRVGALLEIGTGFHPDLTGRENVFLNGSILGMNRTEVRAKFDQIVEFSGVERHIDTPVKWYSSGMYVRLAFAVAAHLEPEILIVDEVLSVGDAEFQKRCMGRMTQVAGEGRTVIFVSHNLQAVKTLCDRALLLEHGQLVDEGDTDRIVRRYLSWIEKEEEIDSTQKSWDDPASRPGDDSVKLVSVRVTDDQDRRTSIFFSSKPIHIVFDIDVLEPDPGLVLVADVISADGAHVFRSYSTDAGGAMELGKERGRIATRCTIPPGLLNGGKYILNVRMHVRGIDGIVNEQGVLEFDVTADHGDSYFMNDYHSRPGVVAPVLEWEKLDVDRQALEAPGAAVAGT